MERLPFSFHPLLIFSYLTDALLHSLCAHSSNLPALIVVDCRPRWVFWRRQWYAHVREIYTHNINRWLYRSRTADLVTPLISGTWPGSSKLWLQHGHLLAHDSEVFKRFLPIGYTTVSWSHIECEHQFASRTAINSCGHVWEVKSSLKTCFKFAF